MRSIPPEIWTNVFKFLPAQDILNMPFDIITASLPLNVAAETFNHFHGAMTFHSLGSLSRIAHHPILKSCLSSISFEYVYPGMMPQLPGDYFCSDANRGSLGLWQMSLQERQDLSLSQRNEQQIFSRKSLDLKMCSSVSIYHDDLCAGGDSKRTGETVQEQQN